MSHCRHVLATFSPRCIPAVNIKVGYASLPPRYGFAVATLCHVMPRCISLCIAIAAATQHSVLQRIVTYRNVGKTQHNVVHEFCSQSVTCLLRCSHVVVYHDTLLSRCSTFYHFVAMMWYVMGNRNRILNLSNIIISSSRCVTLDKDFVSQRSTTLRPNRDTMSSVLISARSCELYPGSEVVCNGMKSSQHIDK